MARLPFFTIGHSNRTIDEFVALLRGAGVEGVVDVRKMPGSKANPQFDQIPLGDALSAFQMSYEHVAALGGLRAKDACCAPDTNGFWENRSFHNYADYALSPAFRGGLAHLREAGGPRRCAIMCAEALWWRCHRRIIADYLIAAGETVFHIMGEGRLEPARLTAGAIVQRDGALHYPAASRAEP